MADLTVQKILNITKVEIGEALDAIEAVIGGSYSIEGQMVKGYHDGIPGPAAQDHIVKGLGLSLQFESNPPVVRLMEEPEGDVVVTYRAAGGLLRTMTFKNVRFGMDRAQSNWMDKTGNAYGRCAVDGSCTWGADDTLTTMLVDAEIGT